MAISIATKVPFVELLQWHPRDIATYLDIVREQRGKKAVPEVGVSNVQTYATREEWEQANGNN